MKIQKFEDIIAWQKSQDFAIEIYRHFSKSKDFGFRDQIYRASVSISNNIAEGFDRSSNAESRRFLYTSYVSCSECKHMLYLAERLNYLSKEITNDLRGKSSNISKNNCEINKIVNLIT